MRQITEALAARLGREATTLALCWRIVRRDGVALGFTAHDRELFVEGMAYRPAPGAVPSAIELSDGLDADTMEVAGALSGDGVAEVDLRAGRFDGALVETFLIDWERPDAGRLVLTRGTLGTVERRDGAFTAELRGATAALAASPVELVSPECRAELGDRRCRVDLARFTVVATANQVTDAARFEVMSPSEPEGWFAYGRARFLDGPAAGLSAEIVASSGASEATLTIELREPLAVAPGVGDRVELRAGCDKRFSTCRAKFGNALNFRGEPHVPGTDALLRYPGV